MLCAGRVRVWDVVDLENWPFFIFVTRIITFGKRRKEKGSLTYRARQ